MSAAIRKRNPSRARKMWHGPATAAAVAACCGFPNAHAVTEFWGREKRAGRLPHGERPHFCASAPRAAVTTCKPQKQEKPSEGSMRSRTPATDDGLAAVIDIFLAQPVDRRIALAEAVLATLICSHEDNNRSSVSLRAADSAALHVLALIRHHYSGEKRLPVMSASDPAASGFRAPDEMPLHLPSGASLR